MLDQITVVGRVGIDPERGTTPWGDPQVSFRMASTRRRQNRETGVWEDAHTNWYRVRATKSLAEHAAEVVRRGQLVIVVGRLTIRTWERDGARGTAVEIDADSIGLDLTRHRVTLASGASGAFGTPGVVDSVAVPAALDDAAAEEAPMPTPSGAEARRSDVGDPPF